MKEKFTVVSCAIALASVCVTSFGAEEAEKPEPASAAPTVTLSQANLPVDGSVEEAAGNELVEQVSFMPPGQEESLRLLGSHGDVAACGSGYYDGGLSAGFDYFLVKPQFENNVAFTLVDQAAPNDLASSRNFQYDYEGTPRVWIAYEGSSGFSARSRYWSFDHDASSETFVDAAGNFQIAGAPTQTATGGIATGGVAGDTVGADSSLEIYLIDAEVGQRLTYCYWDLNIGGGVRHGAVAHEYDAVATGSVNATSAISQRFDGIGPTLFLEARRPIGMHGLSLIANGRYSLLRGDYVFRSADTVATTDNAEFDSMASLRIGEIQLGVEWTRTLCSGTRLFALGLWEAQSWAGAGNASSKADNLGLFGFTISAGLAR